MKYRIHLKLFVFFCAVILALQVAAQSAAQHFIYIQSDNKQQFYVKLNGKNYSSSSIGYLIVPRLTEGSYTFQVGFPFNAFPEQTFTLSVGQKDLGYALKNFDAKGWGLFNFQSMDVVMSGQTAAPEKPTTATAANTTSAFGNMLANVVDDSTLNNVTPVAPATKTAPATSIEPANNSGIVPPAVKPVIASGGTKKDDTSDYTLNNQATDSLVGSASGVIKAWENTGDKGTDIAFIDFNKNGNDTIYAFIPPATNTAVNMRDSVAAAAKAAKKYADSVAIVVKAALADSAKGSVSNPFFNNGNTATNAQTNISVTGNTTAEEVKYANSTVTGMVASSSTSRINTSCSKMMSDEDVNKLKKRIVSQSDAHEGLAQVRKVLKEKCINTAQVKDIGNLFLTDDDRYNFYEVAYPAVYDYGMYGTLENTLISSSYKTLFKGILK